jgi:hypothetical protein
MRPEPGVALCDGATPAAEGNDSTQRIPSKTARAIIPMSQLASPSPERATWCGASGKWMNIDRVGIPIRSEKYWLR